MPSTPGTRSHWHASADAFGASAAAPDACDIAIVGAGIAGASAALALHDLRPALRVAVLDAATPGHGASGRNAGFLLLGTSRDYASAVDAYGREAARRLWRFTAEAVRRAAERPALRAAGARLGGSVVAAGDAVEAERLMRSHALLAEDGVASTFLRGADVAAEIGLDGFPAALVVEAGGSVDPLRLVRACLGASGATVTAGWRLAGLEAEGDGVRLHAADGRALRAGRVLLAVGAAVSTVVPALAPLARPVRAQMFATEPLPGLAPDRVPRPVYSHEGHFYLRQVGARILLGGARHLHADEEVGLDDATTPHLQADLEAYLARHLPKAMRPAAAGARAGTPGFRNVERRWSGAMSFSPDDLPIVGDVPGVPGAVWVGGFTGHGMGYGLRFGELAARRLLGLADPDADRFDARRFDAPPSPAATDPAPDA